MKRLLIGLALSLAAASAHAQWVLVSSTVDDGNQFYADPTTKRRTGNIVRMWGLQEFSKPRIYSGKTYYSARIYYQYDCVEGTVLILQLSGFTGQMASGQLLFTANEGAKKLFVEPKSNDSHMLDFACK
jgi:hypothetical protein